MHSKKQKMMRLTSLAASRGLKAVLMKDFSESMSSHIIRQNFIKHGVTLNRLHDGNKTKVVNSIISDYKAIKPVGSVSILKLKKSLRLAIK